MFSRNRIDNETTKAVFYMASEDTEWLKDNFGKEPDIGFPGEISNLPGIGFPGEISNLPGIGFPGEISNLPGIGFQGEISNLPGIGFPGEICNLPGIGFPGEISNLPGIGFTGEISNLSGIGFPREISNLPGIKAWKQSYIMGRSVSAYIGICLWLMGRIMEHRNCYVCLHWPTYFSKHIYCFKKIFIQYFAKDTLE